MPKIGAGSIDTTYGQTSMNIKTSAMRALLVLASVAISASAAAQGGAAQPPAMAASAVASGPLPTVPGTQYSEKGADTCLYCHDEESDSAKFTTGGVFKTRHARRGDKHGPFGPGGLQCEACHGPGANHSIKDSKKIPTTNSQKSNSFLLAAQRNQPCLECHQDQARTAWHAGAHSSSQLGCADCHTIHAERDPVLARATEADVCYRCHKQQRADFHKSSSHPVRVGRMSCSDCHNAHGSSTVAMLNKPTLNQTCYSCHADKRGPVLWEHAPVVEDCTLCHSSHGSPRPALLAKSAPLLCQQCHTTASHPAVARTGSALPGGAAGGSIFLIAGSCTNCHSQVHGSNHPAGAKLMR